MDGSDKPIVSNIQINLFPITLQHKCHLYSECILAEVPFTPSQTFSVLDVDGKGQKGTPSIKSVTHILQ